MPVFDDWADDNNQVDPGELHNRLIQLRENEEPELPTKGQARQRRIKKMEEQLNDIAEFINDCDRWTEQTREIHLIGKDVRIMMNEHLAGLRKRAKDKGREINNELQFVRSQS